MIKVIPVSGKGEHGKDSFAGIVQKKLEENSRKVLILHYADLLKFYCKQYFGWDGKKDVTGRKLLQYVGTDVVRAKHPTFWVESVYRFIDMFRDEFDYFLIPDCRFPDEYEYLEFQNIPLIKVRINRPNHISKLTEEQKNHRSELALDDYKFDYIVTNLEGWDNLEAEVNKFIEYYKL